MVLRAYRDRLDRAGDGALRVAVLVPAELPRWLRNSDIRQNATLLELERWSEGRLRLLPMPPLPRETALAALGPLVAMRAAHALEVRGASPMSRVRGALAGTAWVTRELDADVVLSHGLFPYYAPWVRRRPALVWGPGYPSDGPARRTRASDPRFLRQLQACSVVFLSNEASRSALAEDLPQVRDKLRVIPIFEPHLPATHQLVAPGSPAAGGPLRILFVGREARRKNLPGLVAALERAGAEGLSYALTVVSDFRDGPVAIGSHARVIRELTQPQVFALMREHDVLCMPSREESYGMVYIEALAAGCAVVARDAPVQRAMLGDAARYVDPEDPSAIALALNELVRNDVRHAQTCAGLERYRSTYAPDVVTRRFEEAVTDAARLAERERSRS